MCQGGVARPLGSELRLFRCLQDLHRPLLALLALLRPLVAASKAVGCMAPLVAPIRSPAQARNRDMLSVVMQAGVDMLLHRRTCCHS